MFLFNYYIKKKEKTLVSRQNNSFRDNDNYDNNSINDSNLSFKKEEEKLKNLVRRHSCHCDLCGKNTIKLKITCNFETKQSLNIKQKKINADLSGNSYFLIFP